MRVSKTSITSVSAIALLLSLQAPAFGQSLKDAVQQTLNTSPDILIDAARRLAADESVKTARGGYFPKIDLAAGTGRERSDNPTTRAASGGSLSFNRHESSATLTQMLFDGFGVSSEVDRNEARVESTAFKVAGSSEQLALRAVEAYLEVLRRQELVILTKDNLGSHQRTYDQIKVRADSGVGRKADQEQIEARNALARANFGAEEANLRDAQINFLRIVGQMPQSLNKPAAPDLGALPRTVEDAVQIAIDSHPLLKSAAADIAATEAQHRAAKSFMWPRLDFEAGGSWNKNLDGSAGKNDDSYAMLRLRYNLFKGGSDLGRIGDTKQQVYEATEIRNRAARQLEQSVRLAWNAMYSAKERLPSLKQHADSSAATRDAYVKQFGIGQRTLLDLLDSENEYYTASTNYVNGQYLELFSRYRILSDTARLVGYLGVTPRPEATLSDAAPAQEAAPAK